MVNGVDVSRLEQIVETIKEKPEAAQLELRAHSKWVYGSHAFSEIKDFRAGGQEDTTRPYRFVFHADEPDALLGTNYGPGPAETVMHALACCVTSALVFNAAAQGVKLDKIEMEVEGDIDIRGFLKWRPTYARGCRESG